MAADLSMGGNQITNLGVPGSATDAASIGACWPIGSVFTSVVATDPSVLLGFGTWSSIAAGRMLVGLDSGDTKFDTVEETGGAETVTLTATELPAHTHTFSGNTGTESASHTHDTGSLDGHSGTTVAGSGSTSIYTMDTPITRSSGGQSTTHTHAYSGTTSSNGSGSAFSIMNPYFVVYFWKRTA
jgi:microcystin-dependent protein